MKQITTLLITALLLMSFGLKSQVQPFEFGKVSAEDIQMTVYNPEPDADAVVLAKSRHVESSSSSGFILHYKNFERIKILKTSAMDYANVVLEYLHYNRLERISNLKAMIIYPDGSSYILSKKDFKKVKIDKSWSSVYFSFPNPVPGCIIEYAHTFSTTTVNTTEDFIFQFDIPLRDAIFSYDISEDYDFAFFAEGEEYIQTLESKFVISNVPSIKEGPFVTTIEDYKGKIKTRIRGFNDGYGGISNFLIKPKEFLSDQMFGRQLGNASETNYLIRKAKPVLDQAIPIEQKIEEVRKFIHTNMVWDSTHSIYIEQGIISAFKNKSATSTELNFMGIVLLRYLGIECYPMLVRTRERGEFYDKQAIPEDFDYAIISAKFEDRNILMDFSSPFLSIGEIQFNALNQKGLLLENELAIWQAISPSKGLSASILDVEIVDNEIKGVMKSKFDGYPAVMARLAYNTFPDGIHRQRKLRSKFPRALIENITLTNEKETSQSFIEEIKLIIPGACQKKRDTLLIDPSILASFDENPLKAETRIYEINFGYPFSDQYIFQLEIPEGYEVLYLPESIVLSIESRNALFQFDVNIFGNKIQIVQKLIMEKDVYPKEEYEVIKALFEKAVQKNKDRIILIQESN